MKCTAQIEDPISISWRRRQGLDLQCTQTPRYEVNGELFCRKHAGFKCLELVVKRQSVAARKVPS